MERIFLWGCLVLLAVSLGGCASVGVRNAKASKSGPEKLPKKIYVAEFSTRDAVFNVDREGGELAAFKNNSAAVLQADLVKRLPVLAPSAKAPATLPSHGWLVRGRFLRVNQGSRALRTAIGFGAGATKMETEVQIYDLSAGTAKPFLSFHTTGGSNAEPGAISGIGPLAWFTVVGIGMSGVGNAIHGVTEDSERTAREIRNRLVDYCIEKKMVSEEWAKSVRFKVNDPRSSGSK